MVKHISPFALAAAFLPLVLLVFLDVFLLFVRFVGFRRFLVAIAVSDVEVDESEVKLWSGGKDGLRDGGTCSTEPNQVMTGDVPETI